MPTNKLWIEHTERAAWESVTALRRELAKAEKRIEELTRDAEARKPLLTLLESAKQRLGLAGRTDADALHALLQKLDDAEARLRALGKSR